MVGLDEEGNRLLRRTLGTRDWVVPLTRAGFAALLALAAAVALAALPASGRVRVEAVTITAGPAAKTTSTTATFTFTINPGSGTNAVLCELDGKIVHGSCTSPKTYTGLRVGEQPSP